MEAFYILIILAFAASALFVPWIALVNSNRALRRCDELDARLGLLRLEPRHMPVHKPVERPSAGTIYQPTPAPPAPPMEAPATPPPPPPRPPVTMIPQVVEPPTPMPPPLPAIPPVAAEEPPAAPAPVRAPSGLPSPRPVPGAVINWEQFMGAKLFLWLGGLGLFLAVAFWVKYSFERNLISPEMRVAIGYLVSIGLLVGGVLVKRKAYRLMSHTLCATGVVSLYAVTFACRAVYHFPFFDVLPTFAMMTLITAVAFVLAVRMDAMVVAILGMLGGFITPVILSTGQDNPIGLFGYVALLDAGLIAVVLNRRWNFLTLLAAICTGLMQLAWVVAHFNATKVPIALGVFLGCNLLFLAGKAIAVRRGHVESWSSAAVGGLALLTLGFNFHLIGSHILTGQPGMLFSFALGADLCLLALSLLDARASALQLVGGGVVFLLLAIWTTSGLTPELLNWALGMYFIFGLLHSVFPLVMQKLRPGVAPLWWANFFPLLALALIMLPLLTLPSVSWMLWPVILLVDALVVVVAVLSTSMLAILVALVLSLGSAAIWLFKFSVGVASLDSFLLLVALFGIFFFLVSLALARGWVRIPVVAGQGNSGSPFELSGSPLLEKHMASLSVAFPFLLLVMVCTERVIPNPSPIFGLGLLFTILLLGTARALVNDAIVLISLGCVAAMEYAWHGRTLGSESEAWVPLLWYLGFALVFAVYPFLFRHRFDRKPMVWISSALAWPVQFFLVYSLVKQSYPSSFMGVLPLLFAIPSIASLALRLRQMEVAHPDRNRQLAWFGGTALFFLTLVFPIQFSKQWLTLGWAMEGVALLWLFHRIPHVGLRRVGVALLVVSFVRLGLNPAVFGYHLRGATPILNWYLYSYGLVVICLFAGARLYRPVPPSSLPFNPVVALSTLGVLLAFLLLNIEIADYFTAPGQASLVFEFSGSFARDMSYSLGWALFALVLLGMGMVRRLKPVRLAAIGLLGVTLLKLFVHDLARLDSLYRIGALAGVAVAAMTASFLYQKFFASASRDGNDSTPADGGAL